MVRQSIKEARRMKSSGLTPYVLSVLRIAAAFVYVAHGTQKMFGVPGQSWHAPVFSLTMMSAAGVIETIGGIFMLLGLFTRPVAFLLSGQMAVAYFTQHAPKAFWPILNGGDLAAVFCFLWLFVSVAGPGPISLDRLRGRA
jgi:putative oxidoreductase